LRTPKPHQAHETTTRPKGEKNSATNHKRKNEEHGTTATVGTTAWAREKRGIQRGGKRVKETLKSPKYVREQITKKGGQTNQIPSKRSDLGANSENKKS